VVYGIALPPLLTLMAICFSHSQWSWVNHKRPDLDHEDANITSFCPVALLTELQSIWGRISNIVFKHMNISVIYLVVGGFNPSEKSGSQLRWWFPIIWKNKTCSKPPTSKHCVFFQTIPPQKKVSLSLPNGLYFRLNHKISLSRLRAELCTSGGHFPWVSHFCPRAISGGKGRRHRPWVD
jgi:hypothetical protein